MGVLKRECVFRCLCLSEVRIYINSDMMIIFSLVMSEFYVMHRKTFPSPNS